MYSLNRSEAFWPGSGAASCLESSRARLLGELDSLRGQSLDALLETRYRRLLEFGEYNEKA